MEKIKIACIGDSLTWGFLTDNQETDSCPAVLGKLLGDAYEVRNFGANGHTLSKLGDMPYWSHLEESASWQPDQVIMMLGTNDAKPRNWRGVFHYKEQYQELIDYFKGLPHVPTLILNTIPAAFYMEGAMTYELLAEALSEIPEAVKEIGAANQLQVIDVGKATANRPELFPVDGVHTSSAGAAFIAKTVFEAMHKQER